MAGKRVISQAESENALATVKTGSSVVPSFSSPVPMKGAGAKSEKINSLENDKIDAFASSNPQLTQSTPALMSKFGVGTPVALRHPTTGEITPMVRIEGRYHHPSTFVKTSGHLDEYVPSTTGISTEMGHAKYGEPMNPPSMNEAESDMRETAAQATINRARNQRFRMRTAGSRFETRQPGLLNNLGVRLHPQDVAKYGRNNETWPRTTVEVNPAANGNMSGGGSLMPYTPQDSARPGFSDERFPKEKFVNDRDSNGRTRAEVLSSNLTLMHGITRRDGESHEDHIARVKSLVSQAQAKASSDYETQRKADYFAKFGRELPAPAPAIAPPTGSNSSGVDRPVADYGTVSEPGPDAPRGVPAKAPTKTLNIEGTEYMHPEEFQSRKAAGKRVPNYKLASGGASYVMEKTPVFTPKLDEDGNHVHNDQGVPQYTKSFTTAPKDYTKKEEKKLVMVKGYNRPLSQEEYDYVQANIKKRNTKVSQKSKDAFDNDAAAAARDAAEKAKAKADREAAFNKQ